MIKGVSIFLILFSYFQIYSQNTYYVNGVSGNDANDGLTPATAKKTIQAAINGASPGDTIRIAPATYVERLQVNKPLAIIGTDSSTTILQAPTVNSPGGCASCNVITVKAPNVYIGRLTLKHRGKDARHGIHLLQPNLVLEEIQLECLSPFSYKDSFPKEPKVSGLVAYAGASFVIRRSTIRGHYGRGIEGRNGACLPGPCWIGSPNPQDGNVFDLTSAVSTQAFWIQNGGPVHAMHNVIQGKCEMGLAYTFNVTLSDTIYIVGNRFQSKSPYAQVEIQDMEIQNPGIILIQNNTFTLPYNNTIGVRIDGGSPVVIDQNQFTADSSTFTFIQIDNGYDAVEPDSFFPGNVNVTISRNQFLVNQANNVGFGIRCFRTNDTATIKDYQSLIISSDNVFHRDLRYWIDFRRSLGPAISTMAIQFQATPTLPDFFTIEDKVIHRLDDLTGLPERPLVIFASDSFFVTHQTDPVLRIDNSGIQDALDVVPTNGHVFVKGVSLPYYGNLVFSKPITFHTMNLPAIQGDITVNLPSAGDEISQDGNFKFLRSLFSLQQGDWNLNGGIIYFDSLATLSENLGQTIKGDSGYIETTRWLGVLTNQNVAGFGAELTTSNPLGMTVLRRGHQEQLGTGYGSIHRWFDLIPEYPQKMDFRFRYDPSELNGKDPNSLRLFRSQNQGLSYDAIGGTPGMNEVFLANADTFPSRWTASDYSPVLAIIAERSWLCGNEDSLLLIASPGFSDYLWSTGDTSQSIWVTTPDTYVVTAINPITSQRDTSNIFIVTSASVPLFSLGPDLVLCVPDTVSFTISASNGVQYWWSTGDTTASIVYPFQQADTLIAIAWSDSGCAYRDSVILTPDPIYQNIGNDTVVCAGAVLSYSAAFTGAISYLWSTGVTSPDITIIADSSLNLGVTLQSNNGCIASDSWNILVVPSDTAKQPLITNINFDYTTIQGELQNDPPALISIFVNGTLIDTFTTFSTTWSYQFSVPPSMGDTIKVFIQIDSNCDGIIDEWDAYSLPAEVVVSEWEIFIPNAFSPNGDGVNDTWQIRNIDKFPANEVEIYNRWGNRVYRASPYRNEWDGNGLPDGAYYYILKLNNTKGTTFKGYVSIKR